MGNPSQVDVSSKFGAPLGRRSGSLPQYGDIYLSNVVLDSGGYDEGGAYWGARSRGTWLFVAWCEDTDRIAYLDARSWSEAERKVRDDCGAGDAPRIIRQPQDSVIYWHGYTCPTDGENCGSAPSEDEHSCTCDCGEYIEGEAIYYTETDVWSPNIPE